MPSPIAVSLITLSRGGVGEGRQDRARRRQRSSRVRHRARGNRRDGERAGIGQRAPGAGEGEQEAAGRTISRLADGRLAENLSESYEGDVTVWR